MSTHHGETVTLMPIGEVARFQKNLISANIPENYALKPMFKNIAGEEDIRSGVIAFRDFLYTFFDYLISDGHLYAKPPKKPKSIDDYPFLHHISSLLVDIGYHSNLAESSDSLLISKIPSCTASTDEKGKITKPKIPASSQIECLRFLTLCGFVFTGIDLDSKKLNISEEQMLKASYPSNPIMLTGLKTMAIADIELRTKKYWNDYSLLWCYYRQIKAEDSSIHDVLKDFLHPLPEKVRDFVLNLHQHHMDMGMTCALRILGDIHFAYSYVKNNQRTLSSQDIYSRRVWGVSISLKNGYCLVVRAKKTDKYADVINKFPLSLQEKIAKGYGCDRKLRNERCQEGCQGIRLPLDNSILDISKDIETWLDNEFTCS